MIDTARTLGVGQRTGIDLPAESAGYLGTPESVEANGGTGSGGSPFIRGIGRGELPLTPLQRARWPAPGPPGSLVPPRRGLPTGTRGSYAAVPAPAPTPLPY